MKLRVILIMVWVAYSISASAQTLLLKKLNTYTSNLSQEYTSISAERKEQLSELADKIVVQKMKGESVSLLLLSAENSSSSQIAQAWMQVAIEHFNIKNFQVFSAGTSESAIDKSVIVALKEAGFRVQNNTGKDKNSRYLVGYSNETDNLLMFSKKESSFQIPVSGVISYSMNDLAANDISKEVCREIAREMFYMADKIQSSHLLSMQP